MVHCIILRTIVVALFLFLQASGETIVATQSETNVNCVHQKDPYLLIGAVEQSSGSISVFTKVADDLYISQLDTKDCLKERKQCLKSVDGKVASYPCKQIDMFPCESCTICPDTVLGINDCPVPKVYLFQGPTAVEFLKKREKRTVKVEGRKRKKTLKFRPRPSTIRAKTLQYFQTDVDQLPYELFFENKSNETTGSRGRIERFYPSLVFPVDKGHSLFQVTFKKDGKIWKSLFSIKTPFSAVLVESQMATVTEVDKFNGNVLLAKVDQEENLYFGYTLIGHLSIPTFYKLTDDKNGIIEVPFFIETRLNEDFMILARKVPIFYAFIQVNTYWAGCKIDSSCYGTQMDAIARVEGGLDLLIFSGENVFILKDSLIEETRKETLSSLLLPKTDGEEGLQWKSVDIAFFIYEYLVIYKDERREVFELKDSKYRRVSDFIDFQEKAAVTAYTVEAGAYAVDGNETAPGETHIWWFGIKKNTNRVIVSLTKYRKSGENQLEGPLHYAELDESATKFIDGVMATKGKDVMLIKHHFVLQVSPVDLQKGKIRGRWFFLSPLLRGCDANRIAGISKDEAESYRLELPALLMSKEQD